MAFQKGQSGNPGGRPKEDDEVKRLARAQTVEAIKRLTYWLKSDNAKASVAAATALLDRGYGKPRQEIEHSGEIATSYVVAAPSVAATPEQWQEQHAPNGLAKH